MTSACVGVLSIIELKNSRWNIEKHQPTFVPQSKFLAAAILNHILLIFGQIVSHSMPCKKRKRKAFKWKKQIICDIRILTVWARGEKIVQNLGSTSVTW